MADTMDKQGILDELRRRNSAQQSETKPKSSTMSKEEILQSLKDRVAEQAARPPVQPYTPPAPEKQKWFQKGAFEDGYQFGDLTKTILGTGQDVKEDAVAGAVGTGEKALDFLAFVAPYISQGMWNMNGGDFAPAAVRQAQQQQFESAKNLASDFIKKDLYDEEKVAKKLLSGTASAQALKSWDTDVEDASVLAEKSDAVAQSLGQMALTAAMGGAVPWWVVTGATSFGSESENALRQGATMEQAGLSAAVSAGAEILTEKLFGGSGLGEKGFLNLDVLTNKISNKLVKTLLDYGVDMAAEGAEEVVSSMASNLGSALYREENLAEILFSEEALQEYMDSFFSGAAVGGMMNVGKVGSSVASKTDYRNGLTAQQQKVFDQQYDAAIKAAEKGGKLTREQRAAIYDATLESVRAQQPQSATQSGETAKPETAPTKAESAADGQQTAQTAQQTIAGNQQTMTPQQAIQETIAEIIGVPSVSQAVESYRESGTVTNKQAEAIASDANAVQELLEMAGIAPPSTKSQTRAAVKQAIAKLAQESVDNTPTGDYDRITNQGGEQYAEQDQQPGFVYPGGIQRDTEADSQGEAAGGAANGSTYAGDGAQSRLPGTGNQGDVYAQNSGTRELTSEQRQKLKDTSVIDSTGEPVAVYHTTDNTEFETFAKGDTGFHFGSEAQANTHRQKRGYTDGRTIRAYLDIKNPIKARMDIMGWNPNGTALYLWGEGILTDAERQQVDALWKPGDGYDSASAAKLREILESKGYDGIVYPNGFEGDGVSYMVFRDEQIVRAGETRFSKQKPVQTPAKTSSPAPDESVGAAPAGFGGDFYRLQAEYGNLPAGENPVRPDDMPASTTGFDRVSQTAVTVKGAEVTPDSLVGDLEADVVKGGMSYIPIKNSDTTQEAVDYINREGWTQALANWTAAVNSGKSGADLVAQGALLLNNAATAGNKKQWLDILHTYQKLGTNTAQGLQAMRILKTLQPSDKLYMIRRSVEQMVSDMKLKTEIVLDEDLMESYRNAETDAERDEILSQIQQSVAGQIPSTFMDKVNALRYLNMLGNLKTQVRNLAGNVTMAAVSTIKNEVGAGIELIANKVSGGKVKRTKSFGVSKEQLAAAKSDFDSVKEFVTGERRYDDRSNESDAFRRGVLQNKRVFKSKALEGYRKLTSEVMEKGDLLFSKPAYARALAGYLKANGITETDYSKIDQEFLDEARLYAINEAQEQTFRDTNMLAEAVSKRYRGSNKILKAGDALLNAIIPFRKTPANVLLRAEEYSPLGIANALWNTVQAGRDGSDVTANDAINSWAKSLTGSGLFALGMLLSNLGLLSAGADEDKDKEAFESLSGYQNYAFVARDGTNVTIDFLSPAAIPLLMGAELMEAIHENGFTLEAFWDTAMSMTEPMIQMSMLQSLNDTIEDVRYSDDPSGQIVVNAALNYLMQATTNTLFGQLERGTEDVRMTTYVDKNSPVPDWLQKFLGKASAKTPFWDYNQIPYINAWGEEEENLPTGLNLAYNLLSPGYVESGRKDALTEELNRLGTSTGESVYPDRAPTYITVGGEKKNLSAEEYVAFAKDRGQTQKKLMDQLLASSAYNSLTDAQKAKAVKKVYEYADRTAKKRAEPGYDDGLAKWIKKAANRGDLVNAIINWSKE